MTETACKSAKRVLASDGAIASDFCSDMIVTESRFPPRDQAGAPVSQSYPSNARVSALARRRASRWPRPADTCARLRQAWRRRLLSGSSRHATDQDAAARRAPSPSVRIWSKPRGKIPRHHGSAVAETDFRRANIAPRVQDARSDISLGNRGMTVQPANSPYAGHIHTPCRTRLAARPKVAASRVAGCWVWREERGVLAAAEKPASLAMPAAAPIPPTR